MVLLLKKSSWQKSSLNYFNNNKNYFFIIIEIKHNIIFMILIRNLVTYHNADDCADNRMGHNVSGQEVTDEKKM